MNKNCNHFWEIDFLTLENKKPTFICMNCGKKKKDNIPILDSDKLEKVTNTKNTKEE